MRRIGSVWETIVSFDNLCSAAQAAARSKRAVRGVARFMERLEPEVLQLQRELRGGSYRPGAPVTFTVHDPKTREITAAPFRDRVVHHALIDPLEPWLDRRMIAHSYACRRGKGQHRALRRARQLIRRHEWFLKLDVRAFFPSLRHDVVLDTLRRVVKDRCALRLAEAIIRAGGSDGTGLPIGHLTSQWFANLVLDRLDHEVTETMRAPGYLRYMDDFVLFADAKSWLREAHAEIAAHLAANGLELKDGATVLAPARQGLPFLGFRIYRGTARLRPDNLRRTRARLRHRQWQFGQGVFDEARLADCTRSVTAHLTHGNTLALRRSWFTTDKNTQTATDRQLLQPRQPRQQLQQPRQQRAVGQPQQQRTDDPQQQPGPASRQDVALPDRDGRLAAPPRRAP
jgi:RNA-directed DNA polymerase